MDATRLFKAFFRSREHGLLALLTLGVGLMSATPLGLIVGAVGYVLGWLYMPDTRRFKERLAALEEASLMADESAQLAAFQDRRQRMLAQLDVKRRARYDTLAANCGEIERVMADENSVPDDPRLRKLDELMWTYLRLLCLEARLESYLGQESHEDLDKQLQEIQAVLERDGPRAAQLSEGQQRLLRSKEELAGLLRQRIDKVGQAQTSLELTRSELSRLEHQAGLIKGELVASRKTDLLSDRISSSFDHFAETNRWMKEMDEFKTLVGEELPQTQGRIGYQAPATATAAAPQATPAAAPQPVPIPTPPRLGQRQGGGR